MTAKNLRDVARIVSNVLQPYLILLLAVAIIAYHESSSWGIWATWTVVTWLSACVLPLVYIRVKTLVVAHVTGTPVDTHSFFRERPAEMALPKLLPKISEELFKAP